MSRARHLAGLGAVMCLLAGAFAVPALYLPGLTLLALTAFAAAAVLLASHGARVELEVPVRSIHEGDPITVSARLRGTLAPLCRAELRVVPGTLAQVLGARTRAGHADLRPRRRGRLSVGPAAVRWADPFQICVRERSGEMGELLVLPRVHTVGRPELERILSGPQAQGTPDPAMGADGLRPYRQGTPASHVHWLTLARTGTLMERRPAEEATRAPVTIVLDARAAASEEALDMAVRAAASLCLGLARLAGCAVLLPGARPELLGADLSRWPPVHERLALVAAGEGPMWQAARGARRLVLVHAGSVQLPQDAPPPSFCVSPLADPRVETFFSVAGCAVQPFRRRSAPRAA